ncbi:MAG TPA: hypothetical protein VLI67_04020 [Vicinamibacteria bacterium]|nr:hypothetical protein [Vicinamibacteria bacterium]
MPVDVKDRIAPRGKYRLIASGVAGDGNSFTTGESVCGDYHSLEDAIAAMGPTEESRVTADGLPVWSYTSYEVVDDTGGVVARR